MSTRPSKSPSIVVQGHYIPILSEKQIAEFYRGVREAQNPPRPIRLEEPK